MIAEEKPIYVPRLWSDFDGTAVELLPWRNPRNWTKYPLAGIVGYIDFLRGVKRQGVEIGGVVTARPQFRRWTTGRSIAKLGYDEFFHSRNTVLVGSHSAKANFLAAEAEKVPIGMIEDLPHRVLPALIGRLLSTKDAKHTITLGIVNNPSHHAYIEGVMDAFARDKDFNVAVSGDVYVAEGESFSLRLIPLEPYSEVSGQEFGRRLIGKAN